MLLTYYQFRVMSISNPYLGKPKCVWRSNTNVSCAFDLNIMTPTHYHVFFCPFSWLLIFFWTQNQYQAKRENHKALFKTFEEKKGLIFQVKTRQQQQTRRFDFVVFIHCLECYSFFWLLYHPKLLKWCSANVMGMYMYVIVSCIWKSVLLSISFIVNSNEGLINPEIIFHWLN